MPLFGDHYDGMTRVAAKGMGIMLHWKYMTEDDLYTALTSVITDSRLDSGTTVTHSLPLHDRCYVSYIQGKIFHVYVGNRPLIIFEKVRFLLGKKPQHKQTKI